MTAVITNFRTEQLVRKAVESLLQFYPDIRLVAIDNGSGDGSSAYISTLAKRVKTCVVLNSTNQWHGHALHQGMLLASTPFVLTFDSDCVLNKGGLVEGMLKEMQDEGLYATGWLRYVNSHGVSIPDKDVAKYDLAKYTPYLHPACGLYRKVMYMDLPPFACHGAPACYNMVVALGKGYKVRHFPVWEYVRHLVAGTRRMYGGRWDPNSAESPKKWDEKQNYPI